MSNEVLLHGQPVKVGDKVWDVEHGYGEVESLEDCIMVVFKLFGVRVASAYYFGNGYYVSSKHEYGTKFCRLFFQPIDPAAIEAAKIKPKEPEYEYQWIYESTQTNGSANFGTTGFFKDAQLADNHLTRCLPSFVRILNRIEESKREAKS